MEPILELATRATTLLWQYHTVFPERPFHERLIYSPRGSIHWWPLWCEVVRKGALDSFGAIRDYSRFQEILELAGRSRPEDWDDTRKILPPSGKGEVTPDARLQDAFDYIESRFRILDANGLFDALGARIESTDRLTREALFERVSDVMFEMASSEPGRDRLGNIAEVLLSAGGGVRHLFFLEEEIEKARPRDHWYSRGHAAPPDLRSEVLNREQLKANCLKRGVAVPFSMVQTDELDEIARSRLRRLFDAAENDPGDDGTPWRVADSGVSFEHASPVTRATDSSLFGLALSGGGIRSATFALGLLQGMADRNILPWIDIISTVSGGGYIGSWLVAWTKRRGSIRAVQESLQGSGSSPLRDTQLPMTTTGPPNLADPLSRVEHNSDPHSDHVRPVRLLRAYSRYLAPNKGSFSLDTWTIGSIWLRNASLNLLVLLLAFAVILLLPRLVTYVIVKSIWNYSWRWLIVTGLLLIAAAWRIGIRNLRTFGPYRRDSGSRGDDDRRVRIWIIAPLAVSAVIGSAALWMIAQAHETWREVLIAFDTFLAITMALLGLAPRKWLNDKWFGRVQIWTMIALASSVGIGFLLLNLIYRSISPFYLMRPAPKLLPIASWLVTMLGMPLLLAILTVIVTLFIGLMGNYLSDEQREWWGRLGAATALAISGWMILCSIALFAPLGAQKLSGYLTAEIAAGGGWVAITWAGVKTAFSAKSGRDGDDSGMPAIGKIVLAIAPAVFVLGFLSAVSCLIFLIVRSHAGQTACGSTLSCYGAQMAEQSRFPLELAVISAFVCLVLAWRLDINEFSMHNFYKNRLVRAYLGASRARPHRYPNAFTGFDLEDDIRMARLTYSDESRPRDKIRDVKRPYVGPFPIINTALNVTQGGDLGVQDRQAESFVFTPLWSGFDFSRRQATARKTNLSEYGFRQTKDFGKENEGPMLGTAMAISGAAFNSNMGFHTSPPLAFLLTVFGVRLGWWAGNPRAKTWQRPSPGLCLQSLLNELTANTTTESKFVLLSDGGHFENMALYELIRRRCRFIIVSDAEEDEKFKLEGIGGAIRKCRVDFGVVIDLNLDALRPLGNPGVSRFHYSLGTITYPDGTAGKLVYVKASVTGDEPVDVVEFRRRHGEFPHTSTMNQFFDESHFESYRALGHHTAYEVFTYDMPKKKLDRGENPRDHVEKMFRRLDRDWEWRLESQTGHLDSRGTAAN